MVRATIFDVDGTLVDSVDLHAKAWQDVFSEFGHDFSFARIRSQIGKGGDQLMPEFLTQAELEAKGEAIEKRRGEILRDRYMVQIRPFPKVRDLFQRLRDDGVAIVLASSAKESELEVYKKLAGVSDLIDAQTTSDEAARSKPHADIFEAALGKLTGIGVAETIAIGDTPYDAEAAGKTRLRTAGVLCGGFSEASLREAGCVAVYRDPAHLLEQYDRFLAGEDPSPG